MAQGPYVMGIDFGTESVRVGIFDLAGRPVIFASEPYPLYHPHAGVGRAAAGRVVAVAGHGHAPRLAAERRRARSDRRPERRLYRLHRGGDGRSLPPAASRHHLDGCARRRPGQSHRPGGPPGAQVQRLRQRLGRVDAVQGAVGQGERAGDVGTGALRRRVHRLADAAPDRRVGGQHQHGEHPRRTTTATPAAGRPTSTPRSGWTTSSSASRHACWTWARWPAPCAPTWPPSWGFRPAFPWPKAAPTPSWPWSVSTWWRRARWPSSPARRTCCSARARPSFTPRASSAPTPMRSCRGSRRWRAARSRPVRWSSGSATISAATRRWKPNAAASTPTPMLNEKAAAVPIGSEGSSCSTTGRATARPTSTRKRAASCAASRCGTPPAMSSAPSWRASAYGTEHILRNFRENGYVVQEVVAAGGATKSRLWMQIHADVSNVPITLTEVADAPTLGSAILAAVGAGLFPDVTTAAGADGARARPDSARPGGARSLSLLRRPVHRHLPARAGPHPGHHAARGTAVEPRPCRFT